MAGRCGAAMARLLGRHAPLVAAVSVHMAPSTQEMKQKTEYNITETSQKQTQSKPPPLVLLEDNGKKKRSPEDEKRVFILEEMVKSLQTMEKGWEKIQKKISKDGPRLPRELGAALTSSRDVFQHHLDLKVGSPTTKKRPKATVIERPYTAKKKPKHKIKVIQSNMAANKQTDCEELVKDGVTVFNGSPSVGLAAWVENEMQARTEQRWTCLEDTLELSSRIMQSTDTDGTKYHLLVGEADHVVLSELQSYALIATQDAALLLFQPAQTRIFKTTSDIDNPFIVKYAHMDERQVEFAETCVRSAVRQHEKDSDYSIAQAVSARFNAQYPGTSWSCVAGGDLGESHVCNQDKPLLYCRLHTCEVLLWEENE